VDKAGLARIETKLRRDEFFTVKASGGKFLFSNHSLSDAAMPAIEGFGK
jgi:ABC-type uncharacterized transport system ATPase subunit